MNNSSIPVSGERQCIFKSFPPAVSCYAATLKWNRFLSSKTIFIYFFAIDPVQMENVLKSKRESLTYMPSDLYIHEQPFLFFAYT